MTSRRTYNGGSATAPTMRTLLPRLRGRYCPDCAGATASTAWALLPRLCGHYCPESAGAVAYRKLIIKI
jgi:hypothetical protein